MKTVGRFLSWGEGVRICLVMVSWLLVVAAIGGLGCGKGVEEAISTFSLSGTVTFEGTGLAKVTVTLTGEATKIATTDASGNYSFTNLVNGTYYATPSKIGYAFSPSTASIIISGANSTNNNFTASLATAFSISGVTTAKKTTLYLSGTKTAVTTSDAATGAYSFSGLTIGSYTIEAYKNGWTFTPESVSITTSDITKDITGYLTSWEVMNSGIQEDLKAVCFSGLSETITSTTHAYAVGNNGTFIKTTNGGQSWTSVASPTPESLVYVIIGGGTLIAGSKTGRVYATHNLTPTSVSDWGTWFDLSTYLTTDLKNCFMSPVSPIKIGIYALESNGNLHYLVANMNTGVITSHEAVGTPLPLRAMTGRIDSSPGTVTYEVIGVTGDGRICRAEKSNDPTLVENWGELTTDTQFSPAGENLNCVSIMRQIIWIGSSTPGAIFTSNPMWTEEFSGAPYSFNGLTPLNVSDMTNFLAVGDGGLILRHK